MAEDVETKRCDLCNQSRFELLSRIDRRGRALATEVCRQCGLVSHQKIPSEAELNEFYASKYRREYHGETMPSPRRVMRAWKNGQRIYRQVAPWIAQASKVFEVGAGIGCTVKVFEQAGHEAGGIEPNEGFQTYSHEQLRASIFRGFLFDVPPEPAYDLILLVHVIEHLRSPRTALRQLHKRLRPAGLLYVECPNLGAVATRKRMFHFAHIHNFTPLTLQMLAGCCEFEVVRWFSESHDPNLQALLRPIDKPCGEIPADAYQRTLAAYHRYNYWTYHLRCRYLAPRVAKVLSRIWEWLAAPAYERAVVRQCAARV